MKRRYTGIKRNIRRCRNCDNSGRNYCYALPFPDSFSVSEELTIPDLVNRSLVQPRYVSRSNERWKRVFHGNWIFLITFWSGNFFITGRVNDCLSYYNCKAYFHEHKLKDSLKNRFWSFRNAKETEYRAMLEKKGRKGREKIKEEERNVTGR